MSHEQADRNKTTKLWGTLNLSKTNFPSLMEEYVYRSVSTEIPQTPSPNK